MSPPSSAQASATPAKPTHSRHTSTSAVPVPSKVPSPAPVPKQDVHYTCFIRLPFPRGDFVDPPPVEWDSIKDKALWKLISRAGNAKDLDWETIATRFAVDLPFLLQQAAWLYERHFEGMRKQMQKLGVSQTPSPALPESGASSGTVGQGQGTGSGMQRQLSKDPRLPTLITLKSQPDARLAGARDSGASSPGTPVSAGGKPAISRTPSTTTVTQSRMLGGSGLRSRPSRGQRGSSGSQRRPTTLARGTVDGAVLDDDDLQHGDNSGASDSEEEPSMARSQAFRRGPLGRKPALRTLSSDGDAEDDEEGSSGGYLPFAAAKGGKGDPSATLREPTKRSSTGAPPAGPSRKAKDPLPPVDSSETSSASSAQPPPLSSEEAKPRPINPNHRAQLANTNLSPRYRKDGSEGSPSMGSSFSDLDGDSVTQSALEDALLSNIQKGNMSIGSRLGMGIGGLGRGKGKG